MQSLEACAKLRQVREQFPRGSESEQQEDVASARRTAHDSSATTASLVPQRETLESIRCATGPEVLAAPVHGNLGTLDDAELEARAVWKRWRLEPRGLPPPQDTLQPLKSSDPSIDAIGHLVPGRRVAAQDAPPLFQFHVLRGRGLTVIDPPPAAGIKRRSM